MANAPKPISVTQRSAVAGELAPQPFVIVGGLPAGAIPAATPTAIGGVKEGVAVADAAGANPTAAEFKALLDSLRASGAIATA